MSNPIKILKKDRLTAIYSTWLSSTAAIFIHEAVNLSCTNPTRVHRSWSRDHKLTRSMERYFTTRELVITILPVEWNAALVVVDVVQQEDPLVSLHDVLALLSDFDGLRCLLVIDGDACVLLCSRTAEISLKRRNGVVSIRCRVTSKIWHKRGTCTIMSSGESLNSCRRSVSLPRWYCQLHWITMHCDWQLLCYLLHSWCEKISSSFSIVLINHLQSSVIYIFCPVCLYVCTKSQAVIP